MESKPNTLCVFAALAVLFIVIAGCTGTAPMQPASLTAEKTPAVDVSDNRTRVVDEAGAITFAGTFSPVIGSEKIVTDANNRFAFDLYSRLAQDPRYAGSNIFFSPFSISSALAITYEGARRTTADEIQTVFHFPKDDAVRRLGYAGMYNALNSRSTGYTLHTANSLWAEKTHPFLSEYTGMAHQYYSADTTNLDFNTQPEESRITINQWVENQTENKIRNLIPVGGITPLTRLVITNAIYFKGTWVKQFDKNKTADADFSMDSGTRVRVPMMQRTDKDAVYLYAENSELQMLSMPYEDAGGKKLSMLVLLPKGNNLTAAEASLDAGRLSALEQKSASRRVMVYFPKVNLETEYHLPETLTAMGMPTAFSPSADFSGIDGTQYLYIHDVIHKTYLDVNEEGTEAAAATAVVFWAKGAVQEEPVPVFKADHPFVFLIKDTETGNILFMGRITNPGSS
ncbi:serpin family protein [Methanoregula sp.]|uniref:serpin family protein n=1 Tax=Methanoregula sp. TaxID=2052170 RepID=UPI0035671DF4